MDKPIGFVFFVAPILAAADQAAEPFEKPKQAAPARARTHVLHRRCDKHFKPAVFDDKGRGAEFALATDDVARLEAATDDGALVPVHEGTGDALKKLMAKEVIHRHLFGLRLDIFPWLDVGYAAIR